jgi:hypothetical protein
MEMTVQALARLHDLSSSLYSQQVVVPLVVPGRPSIATPCTQGVYAYQSVMTVNLGLNSRPGVLQERIKSVQSHSTHADAHARSAHAHSKHTHDRTHARSTHALTAHSHTARTHTHTQLRP